jgi:NTE family protein
MQNDFHKLHSRRIGLALSGGAVRGLAHIGVIKALSEAGIKPTVIAGTSAGSLVGAALAAGMDWRELSKMARSVFWLKLLNGQHLEKFCDKHLPSTFTQLKTSFTAVATIVPERKQINLTTGHLPSAVSASCAIPMLRRPVVREGLRLLDGGVTCVLPSLAARELGADFIIASDVWEWSSMMRRLGHHPKHERSYHVYPSHYVHATRHTDILVQPKIPLTGYIPNSAAVERMIAVGEHATHKALASLKL